MRFSWYFSYLFVLVGRRYDEGMTKVWRSYSDDSSISIMIFAMTVWSPKPRTCDLDLSLSGLSVSHCQERFIVRSLFILWGIPNAGRLLTVGSFSLPGGSYVESLSLSWGSHCQEFITVRRSQCRERSGSFLVMEVHQCGMRYSMLSESKAWHSDKFWVLWPT